MTEETLRNRIETVRLLLKIATRALSVPGTDWEKAAEALEFASAGCKGLAIACRLQSAKGDKTCE